MEVKLELDETKLQKVLPVVRTVAQKILSLTDSLAVEKIVSDETPEQPKQEEKKTVEPKQYSFSEVRAYLTQKSRDGYTEQVKSLVSKYGEGKLSSVKPENYKDLMLDAQFLCRNAITAEEVSKRIQELNDEGHSNEIADILSLNFATSIENLDPQYYASFMRDAWEIDHA